MTPGCGGELQARCVCLRKYLCCLLPVCCQQPSPLPKNVFASHLWHSLLFSTPWPVVRMLLWSPVVCRRLHRVASVVQGARKRSRWSSLGISRSYQMPSKAREPLSWCLLSKARRRVVLGLALKHGCQCFVLPPPRDTHAQGHLGLGVAIWKSHALVSDYC